MEHRLRPLGFMEFFAKQRSSGSQENYIYIYIYIYVNRIWY